MTTFGGCDPDEQGVCRNCGQHLPEVAGRICPAVFKVPTVLKTEIGAWEIVPHYFCRVCYSSARTSPNGVCWGCEKCGTSTGNLEKAFGRFVPGQTPDLGSHEFDLLNEVLEYSGVVVSFHANAVAVMRDGAGVIASGNQINTDAVLRNALEILQTGAPPAGGAGGRFDGISSKTLAEELERRGLQLSGLGLQVIQAEEPIVGQAWRVWWKSPSGFKQTIPVSEEEGPKLLARLVAGSSFEHWLLKEGQVPEGYIAPPSTAIAEVILEVLKHLAEHVQLWEETAEKGGQASAELAKEHRSVIFKAESALLPILQRLVGPVFNLLPKRLQDLAAAADADRTLEIQSRMDRANSSGRVGPIVERKPDGKWGLPEPPVLMYSDQTRILASIRTRCPLERIDSALVWRILEINSERP